jgi:hypothetical protein
VKKTVLLGVFLVLACPDPAQAISKLSVGPARLELKLAPGSESTYLLDAVNHGDDTLLVKTSATEFDLDEAGEAQYPKVPGPRSCSAWFRVNPQTLELPVSTSGSIRATVRVPADARGTYWCVLFLEDVPPPAPRRGRGFSVRMNARIGTVVYMDVGDVGEPKLKLESLAAVPDGEHGGFDATALVTHAGGGYLRPSGTWELLSESGEVVGTQETGFPLLPGHGYRARWASPVAAGRYRLRLGLDFGGPKRLVGETVVTVPPKAP